MKKYLLLTSLLLLVSTKLIYAQTGTITTTIVQQPCNNDGIVAYTISGLTPPYTIYANGNVINNSYIVTDTIKNISATITPSGSPKAFQIYVIQSQNIYAYTYVPFITPFSFTTASTPAICPSTLGTATVTPLQLLSSYSAEWSPAWPQPFTVVASGNPISLPLGQYDVRVTDLTTGCAVTSFSTNAYIYSISGISYNYNVVSANCTNGSISLSTPVGGLAPYSYQWSNGATTNSISGLSPLSYTVAVTDAQGCSQTGNFNVPQATTLTVNTTISNATCLQQDGSITAFASGGTAPYTYAWSNGAMGQTATNLAGGFYHVFITDNAGCVGDANNISVGFNTPITVTYTARASSCTVANGSATVTPIGGTAPYSITWSTYPITTGASISNMPVGTYTFNVIDAVGCQRSGTVYIPPISTLNANISSIDAVCPALLGNAYANVSGTNPPFTYAWSNGATGHSILNSSVGYYSCVITDAVQCSVTKYGYINQASPIHVSMYSTPASCIFAADGSATANATGGTGPYTYSWSNGQVSSQATSLITGNYNVGVTDANGCSNGGYTNVSYNTANTSCFCTIKGTVYNDANSNCIKDASEPGIQNQMIHCPPYGYTYSDANGNYSFVVTSGTYTLSEVINGNYLLAACQASSNVVNAVTSSGCTNVLNFANTVIPVHDVQIITTSANTPPVVGNPYMQKIIIQNNGTVTESNIQLGFEHDGQLAYINHFPNLMTQQHASSYPNWFSQNSIPSLSPNASAVINVNYNVPTNIPIGTSLSFYDTTSYASPITTNWLMDNTPWDNVNTFQPTVVAAFDPNYKEVTPKGFTALGLIAPKDSILNYVVHFQNEGSYFAQNITVVDTLDADLDWTSLRPGYSNHNFTVNISETGVLSYIFKNINLAWKSSYGDPLSSGMFSYSIKTKRNLALGTEFINGAAIYFDYNSPVITNKTLNTLGDASVGVKTTEKLSTDEAVLFPNPTTGLVTINSMYDMQRIEIYTIMGTLLSSETINVKSHQLQLQNYAEGIYFVKVSYTNGLTSVKKAIKN